MLRMGVLMSCCGKIEENIWKLAQLVWSLALLNGTGGHCVPRRGRFTSHLLKWTHSSSMNSLVRVSKIQDWLRPLTNWFHWRCSISLTGPGHAWPLDGTTKEDPTPDEVHSNPEASSNSLGFHLVESSDQKEAQVFLFRWWNAEQQPWKHTASVGRKKRY